MGHPLGISMSIAVGIIAIGLAGLALSAWKRNNDVRMLYLCSAFGVFAFRAVIDPLQHLVGWPGHTGGELLTSVLDLATIALLVAPFLHRA